jgi:hypothetical protein
MAVRYEEPHLGPRRNPILSFAREHFTLVGSGVAALIFAIRCVAVTKGDTYTASILLAQTSLGDAIRALLFFVLPVALVILSMGLAIAAGVSLPKSFFRAYRARKTPWRSIWKSLTGWPGRKPLGFLAASVAAGVVGNYMIGNFGLGLTLWFTIFTVIYPIIGAFVLALSLGGRQIFPHFSDAPWTFLTTVILAVGFSVGIFTATVIGPLIDTESFWLPRERLVFADAPQKPLIGYVLNTSGDHFIILNDDPRIIIEKKGPLDDRDFCYPEDHKARSSNLAADSPVCP